MKMKRILGIALIIVGAIMLLFSNYIAEQVAAGQLQIQSAQSQVNTVDSVFSNSQYTKPIGKQITGSAQRKIDEGQAEVDQYSRLSGQLKIAGVICIILGAGILFFSKKRK
jgi:hypothetical protein